MERLGLREKTLIVFWSDHGYHLGEHGMWQKQTCFEEAARVPLIISIPGSTGKGKTSPAIVELLDLYPTLADLAGLTPPTSIQGTSLRPLLENPGAEWKRPAFTQTQRGKDKDGNWILGRSVRTDRWRYTEWQNGAAGSELYDHNADPREYTNETNNPAHAEEKSRLAALLRRNQ